MNNDMSQLQMGEIVGLRQNKAQKKNKISLSLIGTTVLPSGLHLNVFRESAE